jgi:hypothetical protein
MYFHKPVKQASEDVEEAVEYGSIRLHGKFKLMKKMEKQISTQMALKHRNGYIIKKSMFKKKKKRSPELSSIPICKDMVVNFDYQLIGLREA